VAFTGLDYGILALGDLGASGQNSLDEKCRRNPERTREQTAATKKSLTMAPPINLVSCLKCFLSDVAIFQSDRIPNGHPTKKALDQAALSGSIIVRTDELGSVAFRFEGQAWKISSAGKLTA